MTNYDAHLSRAAWSSADCKSQSGQVTSKPLYIYIAEARIDSDYWPRFARSRSPLGNNVICYLTYSIHVGMLYWGVGLFHCLETSRPHYSILCSPWGREACGMTTDSVQTCSSSRVILWTWTLVVLVNIVSLHVHVILIAQRRGAREYEIFCDTAQVHCCMCVTWSVLSWPCCLSNCDID